MVNVFGFLMFMLKSKKSFSEVFFTDTVVFGFSTKIFWNKMLSELIDFEMLPVLFKSASIMSDFTRMNFVFTVSLVRYFPVSFKFEIFVSRLFSL